MWGIRYLGTHALENFSFTGLRGQPFVSRPRTLLTQSAGKFYEVEGELSAIETTPRLLKLISASNLCLVLVIRERVSVLRDQS